MTCIGSRLHLCVKSYGLLTSDQFLTSPSVPGCGSQSQLCYADSNGKRRPSATQPPAMCSEASAAWLKYRANMTVDTMELIELVSVLPMAGPSALTLPVCAALSALQRHNLHTGVTNYVVSTRKLDLRRRPQRTRRMIQRIG